MRHGYPINHFFLMGGSVMSIDVVPLEVDLSKELNEDEKKDEVIGLISELEQSISQCIETLHDIKTLLK